MSRAVKFFSFNKPSDWESGTTANMSIGGDGLSVERTEKYSFYRTINAGGIDGADAMADFALGPGCRLYVLDAKAALWVYDYESRHTELLYPAGHQVFSRKAMLAAEGDALYIADPGSDKRVLSVSPSNGQLVWALDDWRGQELFPLCVAVDAGKRLYAAIPLDYAYDADGCAEVPSGGRIAVVRWNVSGGAERLFEQEALRLEEAAPVAALHNRFFLTVTAGDMPVLLDAHTRRVMAFGADETPEACRPDPNGTLAGLAADSRGALYIGDARKGASVEDERFILKYKGRDEPPVKVAGYRSRADKLLCDEADRMYAADLEKGTITILELQSRTRTMPETSLPEAWYVSGEVDSAEDETVWHKLELLAEIPEETQIRISYFATDETMGVLDGKVVDYTDYFADPTLSLKHKWTASRHLWSEPIVNPRDALLMNAKGRYLRFRLELAGSDRSAPVVHRLRLFFPRQSPIVHLPPIYREDPDGSGFLERFLAIFGTFFDEMEEKIDKISSSLDPDSVSGSYLKWLSGWLALDVADGWEEERVRALMTQAPELYKLRGTRQGLARMLHIYTGVEPYIVEHHQLKHMQETSELKSMFSRLYGDNPYGFCVMMPPECVRTDKQRLMVERIIADQKPAYTDGRLIVLQPWMHADMHTYLGINTVLSEPTLLTLDQRSSMPHHTVLIDKDRDKRMDLHTRLELDSELD
ncbi:phage tail protein [Paenibacillus hodogayensis]|uniref:Phage tail protein n=1 Tax=Paenibacillus hodogayensis TaxID=279208 RepID=A0ABV5W5E4_9BACL